MYYVHAATAVALVIAVAWAVWGASSRAASAIVTITDLRRTVRRASDQQ